ncbi:MAG TPA: hypothetical protein VII78_14860 [Myxococcota bacterium]|jgi:hypothetical protein
MERRGVAYWVLLLLGAGALANGLVMLVVPEPWFVRIAADTGPFNPHLVRDVGAAYATSGIAALWAARAPLWRAPLALTAALFQGMHGAIHVFDVLSGAQPASHLLEDFPGVYLPTLALIGVALHALRSPASRA